MNEAFVWIDISNKIIIAGYGQVHGQYSTCADQDSKVHFGSKQVEAEKTRSIVEFQSFLNTWQKGHCSGDQAIFVKQDRDEAQTEKDK
jgi:hypothetical protein